MLYINYDSTNIQTYFSKLFLDNLHLVSVWIEIVVEGFK